MRRSSKLVLAAAAFFVLAAGYTRWAGAELEVGSNILSTRPQTSVEGVVASVEGSVVRILGGAVAIDISQARVVGEGRPPSDDQDTVQIAAGVRITAQVDLPSDPSQPLIGRVLVVSPRRDGAITGQVQSVDTGASSFRVANEDILVTDGTSFVGSSRHGTVAGLGSLAAGDLVSVWLVVSGQTLTAERVLVFPPPVELLSFQGTVEAIGSDTWTISGRVVGVTGETKIIESPKVGDTVQVIARRSGDALVAVSIVKIGPRPTMPAGTPPPGETPPPAGTPPPTRTPHMAERDSG